MAESRIVAMRLALGAILLVCFAAGGCGRDPERASVAQPRAGHTARHSAKAILKQAVAATQALHSLRIAGRTPMDDEQMGEVDLALDDDGNCVGRLDFERATARIIATDGVIYVRGNLAFWESVVGEDADATMGFLHGRWSKLYKDEAEELASVCELDKMLSDFDSRTVAAADVSQEQLTAVAGVPAVRIVSEEEDGRYDLYIATRGAPYLLKVVGPRGMIVEFSEFNEPVIAVPPNPRDVADTADAA